MVTLCQASLSAVFSDSICLLHVSMSCFGNFSLYFKHFYYYYIYHDLCMIRDLWSNCCKKIMTSRRLRQWLTFFSNKYFLRYANFFRYNAIAHLIDLSISINFCMRWETKKFASLSCDTHFIVIWNWTRISLRFACTVSHPTPAPPWVIRYSCAYHLHLIPLNWVPPCCVHRVTSHIQKLILFCLSFWRSQIFYFRLLSTYTSLPSLFLFSHLPFSWGCTTAIPRSSSSQRPLGGPCSAEQLWGETGELSPT